MGLHGSLEAVTVIKYYPSCVSTYIYYYHIQRHITSETEKLNVHHVTCICPKWTTTKKQSESATFNFREKCIFYGEACLPLESGCWHREWWRRFVQEECQNWWHWTDMQQGDRPTTLFKRPEHQGCTDVRVVTGPLCPLWCLMTKEVWESWLSLLWSRNSR